MIDFYYAPTPNGWKVAIMLEECGLEYRTHLMDLPGGDQFDPAFLAINPNAKIPAIVDREATPAPMAIFESGAVLRYLSEKTGRFAGNAALPPKELDEWLFWQAANLGPMAGQLSHFINYAPVHTDPERVDYGVTRYRGEYQRCLKVLESRLSDRPYILGEYSIADMMAFPWVFIARNLGVDLNAFPEVAHWRSKIKVRPAVRKAIDLHKGAQFTATANADNAPRLFNQTAEHMQTAKHPGP